VRNVRVEYTLYLHLQPLSGLPGIFIARACALWEFRRSIVAFFVISVVVWLILLLFLFNPTVYPWIVISRFGHLNPDVIHVGNHEYVIYSKHPCFLTSLYSVTTSLIPSVSCFDYYDDTVIVAAYSLLVLGELGELHTIDGDIALTLCRNLTLLTIQSHSKPPWLGSWESIARGAHPSQYILLCLWIVWGIICTELRLITQNESKVFPWLSF